MDLDIDPSKFDPAHYTMDASNTAQAPKITDDDIITLFKTLSLSLPKRTMTGSPSSGLSSTNASLIPPPSAYNHLYTGSSSPFVFFTRLSFPSSSVHDQTQEYYIPFFSSSWHLLLQELSYFYEIPPGGIKNVSIRMEGVQENGDRVELGLGLEGIKGGGEWECALGTLTEMGFGREGILGEGVLVVVELEG